MALAMVEVRRAEREAATRDIAAVAGYLQETLGQKVTADKEAGVVSCSLPEGYAIDTADRWLAERAAGARDLAALLKHPIRPLESPATKLLPAAADVVDAEVLDE